MSAVQGVLYSELKTQIVLMLNKQIIKHCSKKKKKKKKETPRLWKTLASMPDIQ